jgi:hypothetical protein
MIQTPMRRASTTEPERTTRAGGKTALAPNGDAAEHSAWLKRIGLAGFLFFLAKGVVWLILAALVYLGITN